MDNRGRLTLPDVLMALFAIAFMGALYPVVRDGLEEQASLMTAGELYLYQLFLPFMVLVLLSVMFYTAVRGGGIR